MDPSSAPHHLRPTGCLLPQVSIEARQGTAGEMLDALRSVKGSLEGWWVAFPDGDRALAVDRCWWGPRRSVRAPGGPIWDQAAALRLISRDPREMLMVEMLAYGLLSGERLRRTYRFDLWELASDGTVAAKYWAITSLAGPDPGLSGPQRRRTRCRRG